MRLQVDTEAKTIKFDESHKLGKLMTVISGMFPNDEWQDYTLIPHIITNWVNPIYWDQLPWATPNPTPFKPWYNGEITCYNIEVTK